MKHLDYFGNPIEVGDTVMRSYPGVQNNLKEQKVTRITPKAIFVEHKRWKIGVGYEDVDLRLPSDHGWFPATRFINLTKLGLR